MSKELDEQIREYAKDRDSFSIPEFIDSMYPDILYYDRHVMISNVSRRLNYWAKWGKAEKVGKRKENHTNVTLWRVPA